MDDYHRMVEAGILHEDSRVELIRARIVDMAPVGSAHIAAVNRLTRLLGAAIGDRGVVSVQNPVHLDNGSEPQPDVAVLPPGADNFGAPTPRASEVLLLIEVAESLFARTAMRRHHCTRRVAFRSTGFSTWLTRCSRCTAGRKPDAISMFARSGRAEAWIW